MKRRNFLKIFCASLFCRPFELFAHAAEGVRAKGRDPLKDCEIRAAHVEGHGPNRLEEMYIDHAVACQAVHQWAANKVAGREVPVGLLRVNPLVPSDETIEQMKKLDVYSVSSYIDTLSGMGSSTFENRIAAIKKFWKDSDTIGVYLAGNDGKTKFVQPHKSMDDFSDASALTVGEAGQDETCRWFVKAHSENTGHVSLVCENPMDTGLSVPCFIPKPDVGSRVDLIEGWLLRYDAEEKAKKLSSYRDADHAIQQKMVQAAYEKLTADPDYLKTVTLRAMAYLKDPEPLHALMAKWLQTKYRFNEKNEVTGMEGTSFAAPAVAGALSAAKYLGKLRKCEDESKQVLTSQELMALALLSTESVRHFKETEEITDPLLGITLASEEVISPLVSLHNQRGLSSSFRGGFGRFDLDKFGENLNAAYVTLDKDPQLHSVAQTSESISFGAVDGETDTFEVTVPKLPEGDTTILRLNLEYQPWFNPPVMVELTSPAGTKFSLNMAQGCNPDFPKNMTLPPNGSWGASDRFFGEKAAGKWQVRIRTTDASVPIDPKNLKLTLHGVREGGLVDKMIDMTIEKQKEARETGGRRH